MHLSHLGDIRRRVFGIDKGRITAGAFYDSASERQRLTTYEPRPQDLRAVARLLSEDWDLVCSSAVNVWLCGQPETTRGIVHALRPYLQEPLISLQPGAPLPTIKRTATLILNGADRLTLADQDRLLQWIETNAGRARIIATATRSVLPMIAAGTFREALYYRLNTVYLDVTTSM